MFVPRKDFDVLGRRETVQVQIPAPLLAGCVALGWLLNLSGRQFPHLWDGGHRSGCLRSSASITVTGDPQRTLPERWLGLVLFCFCLAVLETDRRGSGTAD